MYLRSTIFRSASRLIQASFLVLLTGFAAGGSYQEAPMLAQQVREGKLPPVAERLPEQPAVVQPLKQIGKYGGTWRMLGASVTDIQLNLRMGYEPLLRWDATGRNVVPGVAESWEMQDGGKTFIFRLRKGMKWSDGHPFTSADFIFTNEDVLRNENLAFNAISWLKADNKLPDVSAPDAHTVVFRFAVPYGLFPQALAFQGLQRDVFAPSHYLKHHHPKYVPDSELKAKMEQAGFRTWMDYWMFVSDLDRNPDQPTLSPFQIKIPYPAARCTAVRNPYYWKVDPEGKQLPYIDDISFTMAFDTTVLNLKVMNGEADFQLRRIDAGNFTLFSEQGKEKGYRVLMNPSTNPTCIYVNQYSRREAIRPVLQDRRFRLALAYAVNREEIIELIYSGLAEPSSGFIVPEDTYYLPGMDKLHTEFNLAKANQLLDEMGLKRGSDGRRLMPDGQPFSEILHVYPSEEGSNPDMWQLVADYWRELGLHFVVKHEDATLSFLQATSGNSDFWTYSNAGWHWGIEGLWKVPLTTMSYMAPVHGAHYMTDGAQGVAPPPELKRLLDWFLEMRSTPDEARRMELGHKILKQWAEECYVVGICRAPIVSIVSNRFKNVPDNVNYDYRLKSPGYLGIEQFFIDGSATAK